MSAKTIAIVAGVIVLVVAGVGGYLVFSGDDGTEDTTSQTQQQTANDTSDEPTASLTQYEGEYRITVVTTANGETSRATIELDSSSKYKTTIKTDEGTSEFIVTGDSLYTRSGGGAWTKIKLGQAGDIAGVNYAESYSLNASQMAALFSKTTYKGTQPCNSGTCNVFTTTNEQGNEVTIKIDQDSNRVIEVSGVSGVEGGTTVISYDYDAEVNVKIPANVNELEIPDIPNIP